MTRFGKALAGWAALMTILALCVVAIIRYSWNDIGRVESAKLVQLGSQAERMGRIDEAIGAYERAVSFAPWASAAHLGVARLYRRVGRFSGALAHCETAVRYAENDQRRRQGLLAMGRVCLSMARWEEAQRAFEDALSIAQDCGEAHYGLARVAEATMAYPRMIEELARVAELGPAESSPEYDAEWSHRNENVVLFKRQLGAKAQAPGLLYRLGTEYKGLGRWRDAIAAFTQARDLGNAPADAYFWLGVQAEAQHNVDRAETRYQETLRTCPDHRGALVSLHRILSGQIH